jgi:glycosyltransferase involved in cell wall biosynthesis
MSDLPSVSVIIPTFNRSASLHRTLNALCVQSYPLELMEVLVVADGCSDGTMETLQHYRPPFALRITEQHNQGPAAARNHGAATATGRLLIFLDDDVEPAPSLIEAHVRAHRPQQRQAVIGPYIPSFHGRGDFIRYVGRAWWSDKFCSMQRPGHRFTYRDVLGSNFSLSAELFASLGGFDPAIPGPGGEGYEFGARLIKANVGLTFAGDAIALHHEHETMDVGGSLRRAHEEARADVLLGRKHPALRPTLPLAHFQQPHTFFDRIVHSLAYRYSWLGDSLATFLRWMLEVLECVKLRGLWRRIFMGLRYYWYLRGAADELGNPKALAKFLQGGPACTDQGGLEIEIDLSEGLEAAEQKLDEVRPSGVRLRYREHIIGRIPSQAGAEPLRGEHLRPVLATYLAWPLLTAMALEEACGKEIHLRQVFPGNVVQTLGVVHASEGH